MTDTKREAAACSFACLSERRPDPAVLEGLQLCLREEYGGTYLDRRVYDRGWLAEQAASGALLCAVAFTPEGTAAACICLRENPPFYGVGDLCMHVVRRPFRGRGMGTPLVAWLMEQPEAGRYSAIGSHNATFHTISQRESYSCGLRPCGMLFNLYRSDGFAHSHDNVGCKLSYAVAAKPLLHEGVSLCMPEEHRPFLLGYYASVGVTVAELPPGEEPGGESEAEVLEDGAHDALLLRVNRCGGDLSRLAARLLERRGHPLRTVTACLDMTHPAAAWGCRALTGLGFCFTGVQPFCRGRHYLLLHHPLGVEIPFDEIQIEPHYEPMYRYVRAQFPQGEEKLR